MNVPFKHDPIHPILADACVSVSGLKKNPAAVIAEARLHQVAILNRNKPVAYVISPEAWDYVLDLFDDVKLAEEMRNRQGEIEQAIPVALEDL